MSYREASASILFQEPDGSQIRNFENGQRSPEPTTRIRARGFAASMPVLYPPAIVVLKRGEGGTGALESKMESTRWVRREKSLCGNGLLQGSISPAPASSNVLNYFPK
jgi:hypothetical protein